MSELRMTDWDGDIDFQSGPEQTVVRLGRSCSNDIVLAHSYGVAEAHAHIERAGDVWLFWQDAREVDSSIIRRGRIIRVSQSGDPVSTLIEGDEVWVGNTVFTVAFQEEVAALAFEIIEAARPRGSLPELDMGEFDYAQFSVPAVAAG